MNFYVSRSIITSPGNNILFLLFVPGCFSCAINSADIWFHWWRVLKLRDSRHIRKISLGVRSNILRGFICSANQLFLVCLYGPRIAVKCELQPYNQGSSSFLIAISFVKKKALVTNVAVGNTLLWYWTSFGPNPEFNIYKAVWSQASYLNSLTSIFSSVCQDCLWRLIEIRHAGHVIQCW